MKILAISNLYPPYYVGGYELGCRDVVQELKDRGHDVKVLTSTYGIHAPRIEGDVFRWLRVCSGRKPNWLTDVLKEVVNQRAFDYLCADFQPDVVFLWNLRHISVSLASLAENLGFPTCYYVFDKWLATWEMDHWYQLWRKRKSSSRLLPFLSRLYKLSPPPRSLDLTRAMFSSRFLKDVAGQVGKPVAHAPVIYWGVDDRLFPYNKAVCGKPKRLLYVGQIVPHKGVHTAIQALGLLKREHGCESLSLSIVGDIESSDGFVSHSYVSYLKELAETCGVRQNVTFVGRVPREDLPNLYHAHDILIFPSTWDEPLGITLLEAMSCGLAVVSTRTGGSAEIIEPEFNAVTFPKEDAGLCAQQILRLLNDPSLFESIRENGRRTVEQRFRIEQAVDAIEGVLDEAVAWKRRDQHRLGSGRRKPGIRGDPSEALAHMTRRVEIGRRLTDSARRWLGPAPAGFWTHKLRNASQIAFSSAALVFFPTLFEPLFWLAGMRRKGPQVDLRQIRSLLILQLADISDVVLASAFLRELRQLFPQAPIGLIVQPSIYNLVEKCPYVNEVVTFNWRGVKNWRVATRGHLRWWFKAASFAVRTLWRHRLDMAISPRWNNDSCQAASLILTYVSGAPWRIGYVNARANEKGNVKNAVDRLLTHGPIRGFPKHEVERQVNILHWLGAKHVDTHLEVWTSTDDECFARQVMEASGIRTGDAVVGFAPGASWPKGRWPVDRFIELGRWLQERYQACIIIFGSEQEWELGSQIERGLQRPRTVNLTGKTTLRQMAAAARHCWLFVANDSGPMHLVTAVGVPVVGLFGPGEYQRFKPWGGTHEAVSLGLPCSPCWGSCMFDHPYCMEGITVDQVQRIISNKLERLLHNAKSAS